MNLSELEIIKKYNDARYSKRISILFYNMPRIPYAMSCCRDRLIKDIMEEVADNRRSNNGELGVRVQNQGNHSDPTYWEGTSRSDITTMIDTGVVSKSILKFVNDPGEMEHRILMLNEMHAEYDAIKEYMDNQYGKEIKLIEDYLSRMVELGDMADDINVAPSTVYKKVIRFKARLTDVVKSKLESNLDGGIYYE